MNGTMNSQVTTIDIRGDKSELSLLGSLKDSLNASPISMPTLLLYNEKGLKLFEEITYLDEYYLTNAEIDVLNKHADAMADFISTGARLVELGSGNLRKVNILLQALERARKEVDYYALDVSLPELQRTFAQLESSNYKYVRFNALHGTYDDGLAWLEKTRNNVSMTCVMSLGSSIGNFSRDEAAQFLSAYNTALRPGDLLIVGLDACNDGDRIYSAYNDSQGVTEQFYRNGLDHANSLLGYEAFRHSEWGVKGVYDKAGHRHQAYYVALDDINTSDFIIRKGQAVPFEHSDKYTQEESDTLWKAAGLIPLTKYANSNQDYILHILSPSKMQFSDHPREYAKNPVPSVDEWRSLWLAWDTVTKSMVPRDELLNKPIHLRNTLIFYLGHIPCFADMHYTRATGANPVEPASYRKIFERGIDPGKAFHALAEGSHQSPPDVDNPEKCHDHSLIPDNWPPLAELLEYEQRVRSRIKYSVESGEAAKDRKLARGLWLAYEHEAMHLETFLYMLLQSERVLPPPGNPLPDFEALARAAELSRSKNQWHPIPAANVKLGTDDAENDLPPDRYFVWDNERPSRNVDVPKFEAQSRPISNGEYAKFLEATQTNKLPASWTVTSKTVPVTNGVNGHVLLEDGPAQETGVASGKFLEGKAIRTVYGPVPLKYALDWPVMASYDELAAFAIWAGGRIPTLEEVRSIYHYVDQRKPNAQKTPSSLVPAVNGHLSNEGVEETPPSNGLLTKVAGIFAGNKLEPNDSFVDLNGCNVAFKHFHPTPVTGEGGRLRGQGDTGGLWEWTSSPLASYEGFKPMDLYPPYTADFFDEKHNVCLGGSWATVPRIAGRKSFVNWYQRNYPYVWCTARLVRDAA